MSEYTPSTEEVRDDWDSFMFEGGGSDGSNADADFDSDRRNAQFDRWLAEVERAAAEKGWDRCIAEMPLDPDWKNYYGDNNPYRLNEGEKQVMKETCSFCEQQVDSTSIGSDGKTKACADCMGEGEEQ